MELKHLFKDNILIDDHGKVCVTDFGIARILSSRGFTTTSEPFSLRWSSIEILRAVSCTDMEADDMEIYHLHTLASDVWAFAMTILQVGLMSSRLSSVSHARDVRS